MKKLTFPLLLATALVAAGCSSDENVAEIDDSQRSAIELSGANSVSRAGFTEANTTLKLHYVSTKKTETGFDDGADKGNTLYMTSSATAAVDGTNTTTSVSAVTQTTGADGQKRYWDDVHGRNSNLSIYAIAVPNKTSITKNATAFNAWDTNVKEGSATAVANTIAWEVSATQTLETIADEDLAYSNNVSGENTLGFNTTSKTFEKAEGDKKLVFNHALSRFTINIKKGDGFGDFANSFNVSSVKFTGFDVKGTLDVVAGTISGKTGGEVETVGTKADYPATGTQTGYTYVAQVFPGTTIKDVATAMLTITVDGNVYPITGAQIYNALHAITSNAEDDIAALKPGKNYNLTINLKKTAIEITSAQLVDWVTINATEMTPSNAIALEATMEQNGGVKSNVVASDLYRSTSLATGYTEKTTLAADGKTMGTTWYWPNNNTKYYFRTISPQYTTVATATNDNITMTGGAIAATNDYIWGAPLEEKHGESATEHKFTYNNGYGDYLYSAIGPTESAIHLTQFHMMSNLQVNLTTSTGDDKVDLSGATVEILGAYNTATLDLCNAKITTPGDKVTSQAMTPNTGHTEHTYRAIPQSTSGITLKITAAGNVYNVKLPADTGIDAWLPGKAYVYTFKLVKTAIHITTAQLVDWETVTAPNKTVTIE